MIQLDLTGKIALVTGGSQGLGAATVRVLAQAGAAVVVNHYPDPQQARQAAQLAGGLSQAVTPDVGLARDLKNCQMGSTRHRPPRLTPCRLSGIIFVGDEAKT